MLTLRAALDRGHANHGWLDSYHSFSFADYHDPKHEQFGVLRVINDDVVAPGHGFPMHGHKDMEIVTYMLSGALEHKDSMGNGSVIRPGDVQRMSAGTGVRHSEFNPSATEAAHLLQIWLLPRQAGSAPSYEQKHFSEVERRGRLLPVASGDARHTTAVHIQQNATLYAGLFDGDEAIDFSLAANRQAYLHVARGALTVNGQRLQAGDALLIREESAVQLSAGAQAEVLLFDLVA
ncbi:MAG: pirin family protein [Alphaproteobacteria bacterium]|nr:pirin family protein [Alphaproteobacteria bacterium]